MKNYLLSCMLALLSAAQSQAQFVVGADGMTILGNTSTVINGLTINPAADLTISDNAISISTTEIPGSPASILRVYELTTPILFEGELGLFYLDPSELNGNTEVNLQVAYVSNNIPVTSTGSTVNSSDNYVYNNITPEISISKITAASLGALPVTLLEFSGKQVENRIDLNWKTTSETNSDFFEIQKKLNSKNWMTLGRVESNKNSSELKNYSISDHNPAIGNNLFRIKMVDINGAYSFSKIINVKHEYEYSAAVYPNPVGDQIVIRPENNMEISSLQLLNLQGQELFKSSGNQPIEMNKFSSGMYLLQVKNKNGSIHSYKIVKP